MRSTFKVLFYVKKGSEKPNGNLPLMCRPRLNEHLRIEQLCNGVGLTVEAIKKLFNGQNILDWFKQKYQEVKQVIRPHIKPTAKPEGGKNRSFKRKLEVVF